MERGGGSGAVAGRRESRMAEDEGPGNTEPQGPPDVDATRADLDATQADAGGAPGTPPLDATQADPGGAPGTPPLDATREQPPVDGAAPPPVWSARAQVRPPGDAELAEDEWVETAQPGRGIL